MEKEKEDLGTAIKALDIEVMEVEKVVHEIIIDDNFNKMVLAVQANMVIMLHQNKKV